MTELDRQARDWRIKMLHIDDNVEAEEYESELLSALKCEAKVVGVNLSAIAKRNSFAVALLESHDFAIVRLTGREALLKWRCPWRSR